ncbi:MAG TPA: Zn-ribbon domain-containing OB-fold protein [Dehalococcoidia bacterium]|nr:Zn-ribbon domain-containing OB-fold protein [Dehalococcoidia bacterium]
MREKIEEWPGTALKEADIAEKRVLLTEWHPNLKYAWDAGIGYGRYFAELKRGRIMGTKCHKCRRVLLPARAFCECCFRTVDEWIRLKDTGTVNTFSIAYTDSMANRIKEPQIPALIEIDGSGGVAIMHLLGEVDPKQVKIGMRVKAVWKPEAEREGAITDIEYWKPIEG